MTWGNLVEEEICFRSLMNDFNNRLLLGGRQIVMTGEQ